MSGRDVCLASSLLLHCVPLASSPLAARAQLAPFVGAALDGRIATLGDVLEFPWGGATLRAEVMRLVPASPATLCVRAGTTIVTLAGDSAEAPITPVSPVSPWKQAHALTYRGSGSSAHSPTPPSAATSTLPVPTALPPTVPATAPLPGFEAAAALLRESLVWPLAHPAAFAALGITPHSGVLLHGPPGCGKSHLVRAIAAEAAAALAPLPVRLFDVSCAELLSRPTMVCSMDAIAAADAPHALSAEAQLRALFSSARSHASVTGGASLLFLDDLHALCPPAATGEGQGVGSLSTLDARTNRIVAQLLTLMDGAAPFPLNSRRTAGHVLFVGATSSPNSLSPALRRPGRFAREAALGAPSAEARLTILTAGTAKLPLSPEARMMLPRLAEGACVGFSGADLSSVAREAAVFARSRATKDASAAPDVLSVSVADLESAVRLVGASALRGARGFVSPHAAGTVFPTWADIGGLDSVVAKLRSAVEAPLLNPRPYAAMGIAPPRGLLLHGPPGNSKTTLARALAGATSCAFFALTGSDILSSYLGEMERALREAFATARRAAPAILLLDELDALVGVRGIGGSGGGDASTSGLLATMLTEMDGLAAAGGVLVIGATNRAHALDPALLRPGRLELHIEVPSPEDEVGRLAVLRVHSRNMPLHADVDLPAIAVRTPGWSGAQLENVCREAAMASLRDAIAGGGALSEGSMCVAHAHFLAAVK